MPRCPHCGEAVKPERGKVVNLDDLAMKNAAKDLYDALEGLLPSALIFADSYRRNYECGDEIHPNHKKLIDAANSALAKARGEK